MDAAEQFKLKAVLDAIMNQLEDPMPSGSDPDTDRQSSPLPLVVDSKEASASEEEEAIDTVMNELDLLPSPYTRTNSRWRKRPNNEIRYLKDQVVELESLLATLQRPVKRLRMLQDGKDDDGDVVFWKFQEELHNRRAKAALMENRKLRATLESRLRVAKAFQCAMDTHVRQLARRLPWPSGDDIRNAPDELIFALLDEGKEQQYAATDEVLESSGVARAKHQFPSQLRLQHGSFHHADVRVLPFLVSDVARALRNCFAHRARGEVPQQNCCHKLVQGGDYFIAVTLDKVRVPGACPAEIKARLLQWSVSEPTRTVVMWSGFVEYDNCRYVRLLEKIWVSIEPIRLKKKISALLKPGKTHGSMMRMVARFAPVGAEFDLDDIKEMADVITHVYHRNAEMVYQALLDQLAASS